ncbi:MAG: NUDIX domain-containing protein [Bacilli bacterium]|nr:NUDIX domain-containing protein [Bacilli bacterium]MBR0301769.1 NUDIX domain-containing protein [Bacilli bacterium]
MDYLKELRKRTNHMPLVLPHSVVILFNEKGEVLLEERADDGFFDFPGGGIDLKESAEDAARRELKEETGLIADELELFKVYSGEITHYVYFNGDEIYGVDLVYTCHKYHGVMKPQLEEVKSLKFYDLKHMPEKMSIRNKQIIKDLLK